MPKRYKIIKNIDKIDKTIKVVENVRLKLMDK